LRGIFRAGVAHEAGSSGIAVRAIADPDLPLCLRTDHRSRPNSGRGFNFFKALRRFFRASATPKRGCIGGLGAERRRRHREEPEVARRDRVKTMRGGRIWDLESTLKVP